MLLIDILSVALDAALTFVLIFGLFLIVFAMELYRPMGEQASIKQRITGMKFHVIQCAAGSISFVILARSLGWAGYAPPRLFDLVELLGVVGAAALIAFAHDFFYYWLHRAQHTIPLLWRFHAVHHSIQHMSAPCSYGHFTEPALRHLITLGPIVFLFSWERAATVVAMTTLSGIYLHSTTRVNFGKFAWVICDNRIHRIHHSVEPEHFNKNFGSVTLLWDKLFGTAHFPSEGEWPDVGLDDQRQPETIGDYVWRPFRRYAGAVVLK